MMFKVTNVSITKMPCIYYAGHFYRGGVKKEKPDTKGTELFGEDC